ncbi:MAG: undecaprenyl-diphosphate phosphatase [Acutalibacteraceae bacterium]
MEYIKMLVMSFVSGAFSALPVSSSAHYAYLNSILHFSSDAETIGFYYSVISVVFSLVVFVFLRKLYSKSIVSVFRGGKNADSNKQNQYKRIAVNLLLSLLPAIILFIPVSKSSFLFDVFDNYFTDDHLMVTSFCCIASGIILTVAIWYSRKRTDKTIRCSKTSSVIRYGIYQLPAYIFPGFSHVSSGAAALTVSNVDDMVITREVLLYLAPSTFIIGLVRMIRYIMAGVMIDPVMIVICVVACLVSSAVVVSAIGRINAKRLYTFASVYSILFGLFIFLASFYA